MIQMLFSLKFQNQLRKIRPELFSRLEQTICEAVDAAGGHTERAHRIISAVFDESALALWLDISIALEKIIEALDQAAPDLYGYACVLAKDIPEDDYQKIVRELSALPDEEPESSGPSGGDKDAAENRAFWCDAYVRQWLDPYVFFGVSRELAGMETSLFSSITGLREKPEITEEEQSFFRDDIFESLGSHQRQNMVLVGQRFLGKREAVYQFCREKLGNALPLRICFGSGGKGPVCLMDALTAEIQGFIAEDISGESMEELSRLAGILSRERLRDQFSSYTMFLGRRFFELLLGGYILAAGRKGIDPVLIIENIHDGDEYARDIILGFYNSGSIQRQLRIYGTAENEECLEFWETLFPLTVTLPHTGSLRAFEKVPLTRDLWEMAYVCCLLRPFFPPSLIPGILEETGKSPRFMKNFFERLTLLRLISGRDETEIRLYDFPEKAAASIGDRRELVFAALRERLLVWVGTGKLRPCFNLISLLAELGGESSNDLLLDSICRDIIDDTCRGIQSAIDKGSFSGICGPDRERSLAFIYQTLKALIHGNEGDIHEAFSLLVPEDISDPRYRSCVLSNCAARFLGIGDVSSASQCVKDAMLAAQVQVPGKGLARSYRLFAIVNLSLSRLSDAIDYFNFAADAAEKSGDLEELAITFYYSAGAHFLFGNLAKAERLARDARRTALSCGMLSWADRALFFQGRLRFETGRYTDALELFESLAAPAAGSPRMEQAVEAWVYRCNVYIGRRNIQAPACIQGDMALFELEAAYIKGNYRRVIELSDSLSANSFEEDFHFIEQADWQSSYSQCEYLLFSKKELWNRFISSYRALALCRLPGLSGGEEALHLMQRIMRDERLPETDPNDAFYLYSHYKILKESGASEVDRNTSVSIAFKRLQKRASRIDDSETKRAFLTLHRWNGELSIAAKEHKLI
ncbi:tetratricopeptide repeat protein [Treponema sp. OttesenSCG-928-L16]|nr:tetratricopeptide repeat protein [Treponema sp. OttesenSCG-928-L16]